MVLPKWTYRYIPVSFFLFLCSIYYIFYYDLSNHRYALLAKSSNNFTNSSVLTIGTKRYWISYDVSLHLYRIDEKPVIWVFWDKPPLPNHIKLSLATVYCHNNKLFHIEIVVEKELSSWIGTVHPVFQFLISPHKADYFRARILDIYGGIYIDADTIAFHSLYSLFRRLKSYDLTNIDWTPTGDQLAIGVIGPIRAKTEFTRRLIIAQNRVLDSKLELLKRHYENSTFRYPLTWTGILRDITKPLMDELIARKTIKYYVMSGVETFGQLTQSPIYAPSSRVNETHPFNFKDTELLMYHNSAMKNSAKELSIQQFLSSDFLLSALIRFSMNHCRKNNGTTIYNTRRLKIIPIGESIENIDQTLITWIDTFVNKTFV